MYGGSQDTDLPGFSPVFTDLLAYLVSNRIKVTPFFLACSYVGLGKGE